ncbi:MAG: flagellar motor switch protein FliG [Alphaproteobacteria bacterium]
MAELAVLDNIEKISGPQKAAAFLLSLPSDYVSNIFSHLDASEIQELSQQMALLGKITSEVMEGIHLEFTETLTETGALTGNFDSTERLLKQILSDEQVKAIMEDIRGPAGRTVWDKLCNVNEELLASFLKNEYPQTVALIISKIRPDHASKVIKCFDGDFALEVISRMLHMDVVQRDVLEDIEKTLKTEFMGNLAKTSQQDPHEIMAEIFNSFDRATETKYMEALESQDTEAAEKIKSLMFTFDDLIKLDASGVQTVIRVADKSALALALKGAGDSIKDLFFSNMSERAAKLMREDMENLGMVRLKDVEDAQMAVVIKTKELADTGEIQISEGGDDEELIG